MCPTIRQGILNCHNLDKKVLLNWRGATSFESETQAIEYADSLWETFGPEQAGNMVSRLFGDAAIDGSNFMEAGLDYETFASRLRLRSDDMLLGIAASCSGENGLEVFPASTTIDHLFVQFDQPTCGLKDDFNGQKWCELAQKYDEKIRLNVEVAGSQSYAQYADTTTLRKVLTDFRQCANFGGIVIRDASLFLLSSSEKLLLSSSMSPGLNPVPSSLDSSSSLGSPS